MNMFIIRFVNLTTGLDSYSFIWGTAKQMTDFSEPCIGLIRRQLLGRYLVRIRARDIEIS